MTDVLSKRYPMGSMNNVITLFGTVTFGTSGAVATSDGEGFAVSKPTGTGLYRITLTQKVQRLVGMSIMPVVGTSATDDTWQVKSLSMGGGTAATTIDLHHTEAGSATDATSGEIALITLHVVRSVVGG